MAEAHIRSVPGKISEPEGASAGTDPWKTHAYVGYSMICKHSAEKKRVLKVLSGTKDPGPRPWSGPSSPALSL